VPVFRSIATTAIAGAAGLGLLAGVAASASASSPSTPLKSGKTTVVVAAATTDALIGHGILPLLVTPASESSVVAKSGNTIGVSFPVTGGSVDLSAGTGTIHHDGGLNFYDFDNGRTLVVRNFVITLGKSPVLTAYVPALKARAPIFDLSLAHAEIDKPGKDIVKVEDIAVTLDPVAAKALDAALDTTLFTPGLTIGTATSKLVTG
jgi:hypothetical protein